MGLKKNRGVKDTNYNKKRVLKPISFNLDKHKDLIDKIEQKGFVFGDWVKSIFGSYSRAELSIITTDEIFAPASIIEKTIEMGFFDLDEYLASKGQKIVNIEDSKKQHQNIDAEHIDYEFNQEVIY